MFEAPRHLIRESGGRIRVLRLIVDGRQAWPLRYEAPSGPGLCRHCGCTEQRACPGGCAWVNAERTLCSQCYERMLR
jgi:hypothetical protein